MDMPGFSRVEHDINEVVAWIKEIQIDPEDIHRWGQATQKREQESAQRAIRERGRGGHVWHTPLYRTGNLFRNVNRRFHTTSTSLGLHVLTIETPVHYANYLADRWPYLAISDKELEVHVDDLLKRVIPERASR